MLGGYTATADFIFAQMLQGRVHTASGRTSIALGGYLDMHIKTDGVDVMVIDAGIKSNGAEVEMHGYSNSTVSADGTLIPLVCTDRRDSCHAEVKLYSAPTVTALGELVAFDTVYATASGSKLSLASGDAGNIYLLRRNSSNIFRLVNTDTKGAADITYSLKLLEVNV